MGFSRPRYNEKARSHRSQTKPQTATLEPDHQLRLSPHEDDLPSNQTTTTSPQANITNEKMSKKKQRRFEAFVAKKLKKDQHHQLLKELGESQSTIHDPSALVSTANLNSASVARTQRELKEIAASIEQRKRERAQTIISSRKRKHKGYHSDGEGSEDHSDLDSQHNPREEPSGKPTDSEVPNSFSGAVMIMDVPTPGSSRAPQPPSRPKLVQPSKPLLGSALAPGVVTVAAPPRKPKSQSLASSRKKVPVIESDNDSFDSSDSAYDSSSSEDQPSSGSTHGIEEEEEEWTGCKSELEENCSTDLVVSQGTESMTSGSVELQASNQQRIKGSFRDWANAQLSRVDDDGEHLPLGSVPKPATSASAPLPRTVRHPATKCGPLGAPLDLPETELFLGQKTSNVPLSRSDDIMASRSLLPVFAEEHTVMDAIRRHPVVVICGETGSGKTTQVPQFLYEAGWGSKEGDNPGMIGITQPRRVAAVSMARRVEDEMGLKGKGVVAFQIRYEATTGSMTTMKFMTDGVLLRELAADFLLTKYSVVIVDEAHERSVNTDVLIGVLSRIVRLRLKTWREQREKPETASVPKTYPLRLIIMSATLRVTDFTLNTTLFSDPPPVITIGARQFPVVVHFNRKTTADYITEAYKKASKIHTRLPPGGILIFLTGQLEIMTLCKKLQTKYGRNAIEERKKRQSSSFLKAKSRKRDDEKDEPSTLSASQSTEMPLDGMEAEDVQLGKDTHDLAADVDDGHEPEEDPEALDTDDEDELEVEGVDLLEDSDVPMYILPLYSLLPTEEQMKVFEEPPSDCRIVIVATNVAETSLTIPNIRYVIDSGRAKERHHDLSSGIQSFEIDWISKASSSQRAGRAGRTGPGHCYRLYSSAVFENYFQEYSKPEIQRMPIDGIVLQMKAMNIDTVTNFPFPTPPDRYALRKAEVGLAHLGALAFPKGHDSWSSISGKAAEASITDMGRVMAQYPLTPRFARMLVSGFQQGCLPYVIALVSILSVGDPFLHEDVIDEESGQDLIDTPEGEEIQFIKSDIIKAQEIRKAKRKQYFQIQQRYSNLGGGASDLFKTLAVVGAYEFEGQPSQFCRENFVRLKAMEEIHKLRKQITKIVESSMKKNGSEVEKFLPNIRPPSDLQLKVLRQLITASFIDQVAVKASLLPKAASTIPAASRNNNHLIAYRAFGIQEEVFIHPSSILFSSSSSTSSDYVVFQELHRTQNRVWIKGITRINPAWLPVIGKSLCTFSKPLDLPKVPLMNKKKTGCADETRVCQVIPRFGGPSLDIELNPIEVTQKRVGTRWVWV